MFMILEGLFRLIGMLDNIRRVKQLSCTHAKWDISGFLSPILDNSGKCFILGKTLPKLIFKAFQMLSKAK